ncbi:MAG: NADH dehydrogenase (quinone) subunit D [Opitutales bacterium]|nr:NADH dehydrogenase (quinone) subunit D [Opitutales bacterium]
MGCRGEDGGFGEIGERMVVNFGPSHPSTHGVLRMVMELDGDIIRKCAPVIGYLHRGDEKIAENATYNQFIPYTDRLDYLAPLCNNIAFATCAEKIAGVEIPERCAAIRVLCCEMSRIASHLIGIAAYAMDAGAWTVFMYAFTQREKLYTLFERLTGARLTCSYARIGGLARDIPEGWLGDVSNFANRFLPALDEMDKLITRNRIFIDRTEGIAIISAEEAVNMGLTGANLRASGVASDLRKDKPYLNYQNYEFDVPVGSKGDCYDRWLVRIEEMRQSVRIIRQVIDSMPKGAWHIDNPKIFAPEKRDVLTQMESLIANFALTTQGPAIPEGEAYFEAENPKGALGFYIISRGGGVPYRVRIKGPSFVSLSALPKIMVGHHITDMPVILGSLDFVLGECDR